MGMVDPLRARMEESCCGAQPGCCCGGRGRCARADARRGASCRLLLHQPARALLAPQKDLSWPAPGSYHHRVARDPEGQAAVQGVRLLVAQGLAFLVAFWSGARKAIETVWFEEPATKYAIGVEATPEEIAAQSQFLLPIQLLICPLCELRQAQTFCDSCGLGLCGRCGNPGFCACPWCDEGNFCNPCSRDSCPCHSSRAAALS